MCGSRLDGRQDPGGPLGPLASAAKSPLPPGWPDAAQGAHGRLGALGGAGPHADRRPGSVMVGLSTTAAGSTPCRPVRSSPPAGPASSPSRICAAERAAGRSRPGAAPPPGPGPPPGRRPRTGPGPARWPASRTRDGVPGPIRSRARQVANTAPRRAQPPSPPGSPSRPSVTVSDRVPGSGAGPPVRPYSRHQAGRGDRLGQRLPGSGPLVQALGIQDHPAEASPQAGCGDQQLTEGPAVLRGGGHPGGREPSGHGRAARPGGEDPLRGCHQRRGPRRQCVHPPTIGRAPSGHIPRGGGPGGGVTARSYPLDSPAGGRLGGLAPPRVESPVQAGSAVLAAIASAARRGDQADARQAHAPAPERAARTPGARSCWPSPATARRARPR